ncbi:MAG: prohibitin family protein, partial [Deltaproteobacteria bacterium]|nr:prohibitin family protein [Deltaproteobacteria bacterium]
IILASSAFTVVGPGERGIVFSKFGGIQDKMLDEGLHFKIPFVEDIIRMDVRIQKAQTDTMASSEDLQMVSSTIAINYHVARDKAHKVFQEIGTRYKERIIDPAVQEAVKAATARFAAADLIGKREEVKDMIKMNLIQRLSPFNIIVDEFNILDFKFSDKFDKAIEEKQEADQKRLKAELDLQRIEIEKKQTITRAEAEAEALRIQKQVISSELLQLRAIEKWDGHFPQVTGGAMPFIDVNNLSPDKR